MRQPVPPQPRVQAQAGQQIHRRALQHTGAHAAFHIGTVAPLHHAGVDAGLPQ